MSIASLMHSPLWTAIGWTMVHFLWVGAVLGIAAAATRAALRRASPQVRYTVALLWLTALTAAPLALLLGSVRRDGEPAAQNRPGTRAPFAPPVIGRAELPSVAAPSRAAHPPESSLEVTRARPTATPSAPALSASSVPVLARVVPYLPWIWIIGTPLVAALVATGLLGAERLRRQTQLLYDGEPAGLCRRLCVSLHIARQISLGVCERVASPVVVGFVRPLILLPPCVLTGCTPEQLEMILLHELAHVRRWDNAVNLIQRLIESLLFFHPAVWWVSHWIRLEREHCCDALVVAHTGRRQAYAETLAALAPVRGSPRVAAMTLTETNLIARIRYILKQEEMAMKVSGKFIAVLSLIVCAGLMLFAMYGPSIGYAQRPMARADERPSDKQRERENEQRAAHQRSIKRESLRYGGRDFDWWRINLETELKAELRVEAMQAMGAFGANGYGKEAAEAVLHGVKDYDVASKTQGAGAVTDAATTALRKIGPAAAPVLVEALKNPSKNVRRFAANALIRTPRANGTVPALIAALKDGDNRVRLYAVFALGRTDPGAEGVQAALIEALKDEDSQIRETAAGLLEDIGPRAKAALPALVEAMRDREPRVRRAAIEALGKIGPDPKLTVPLLIEALRDENQYVRAAAAETLGVIGPAAEPAVSALMRALQDTERKDIVAWTLGSIGPGAKAAVPALTEALQTEDKYLRRAAAEALKMISQ